MTTTPNMNLLLAKVSETLGPTWAQMLNDIFAKLDLHDHSEGNGAKVTPAGLKINAAIDMESNALLRALILGLTSRQTVDTSSLGSLQRIGNNLWWVNASGAAVQITSGASVVSPGSGAMRINVPDSYPYDVAETDDMKILLVDTSAERTINLPSAVTVMCVWVKDAEGLSSENPITVAADDEDLVDGESTYTIESPYQSVAFISDGVSRWFAV